MKKREVEEHIREFRRREKKKERNMRIRRKERRSKGKKGREKGGVSMTSWNRYKRFNL
jgi:hypothetical protein